MRIIHSDLLKWYRTRLFYRTYQIWIDTDARRRRPLWGGAWEPSGTRYRRSDPSGLGLLRPINTYLLRNNHLCVREPGNS